MFNESEIIENLNTYYEYKQQYPEDKYIHYLRSLNLKELSESVLEEQFKNKNSDDSRLAKPLLFKYKARNANGELVTSTIEALSRVDVHSFLEAEGYEVYEITAVKANLNMHTYRMKKNRLIFYLSQLSAYLKSGIALADAVKILDDQAKNTNEKSGK